MPDGAKFCQKCGSKLIQSAAPAQQRPPLQTPNRKTPMYMQIRRHRAHMHSSRRARRM